MAQIQVEYFSNALVRPVILKVTIPTDFREGIPLERPYKDRPMKTVFNLPGFTGGASWGDERIALKYNAAFVSLYGENASYLDNASSHGKFATYVGEEVVDFVRKTFGIAKEREHTYITGISMGGYGAIRTALAFPHNFSKAAGQSSGFMYKRAAGLKPGEGDARGTYDHYRYYFGDPEKVEESEANPEVLVKKLKAQGIALPEIYMCCGTEDFGIENNRAFHRFLTEQDVAHEYHESAGGHDGVFWAEYTPKVLKWLLED